ncbi:MAG TPA: hypothetical protein VJJ82_01080 [Candidatus Nanoarchaeia archaeon]|nr:hypothetical protein [Candidatus Nanoarchaeia archaeon]
MNLGIAGDHCSGKDSAAKYLEGKGLVHISLSDFLRDKAKKRGKNQFAQPINAISRSSSAYQSCKL